LPTQSGTLTALPTDPAAWKKAAARVVQFRHAHARKTHGRRRQPLTQYALAKQARVSQGCLQAFENSTREARAESVQRIARAVGMTVEQLFSLDDTAAPPPLTVAPSALNSWYDLGAAWGSGALATPTHEALAIAYFFMLATTEDRAKVKRFFVAVFSRRTDPPAVELLQVLRAQKLIDPDPSPRTSRRGGLDLDDEER